MAEAAGTHAFSRDDRIFPIAAVELPACEASIDRALPKSMKTFRRTHAAPSALVCHAVDPAVLVVEVDAQASTRAMSPYAERSGYDAGVPVGHRGRPYIFRFGIRMLDAS